MSFMKTVNSVDRKYKNFIKAVRDSKHDALLEIQNILAKNPTLSVRFRTYTPGFMDGEPLYKCTCYAVLDSATREEDEFGNGLTMQEVAGRGLPELTILCQFYMDYVVDILEAYGLDREITVTATSVTDEYYDCGY